MTGAPSENPGVNRAPYEAYSGEGDFALENLPLIEDGNVEAVADILIRLNSLPDSQLMMDRYSVKELAQILDELVKRDDALLARMNSAGLSAVMGQVSQATESSNVEETIAGHTRSALESLKADLSKGADAAADTTSAEALQAGVDAGVEADEAVDGMVGEFTEIFEGDGGFSGKFSKASKLAQKYGKEAQGAFKEAKKAMREVYAEEEGPFALVVALAKFAEVFFDGMSSRREKRKGKEKVKDGREMFEGTRHAISGSISFGGKVPRITSTPGHRWINGRHDDDHAGFDLAAEKPLKIDGTPIVAEQKLILKKSGLQLNNGKGAGYYIHLETPDGKKEKLMHLKKPVTKPIGYGFEPGEVVAYVGSSGASAAHLHYETDLALTDTLNTQAIAYRKREDKELHDHGVHTDDSAAG